MICKIYDPTKGYFEDEMVQYCHTLRKQFGSRWYDLEVMCFTDVKKRVRGMKVVAFAIRMSRALKAVDLSKNQLGPDDARRLNSAILDSRAVTSVYLTGNKLGSRGAVALAPAIRTRLRVVYLNDNHIQTWPSLIRAIGESEQLEVLDLSWNDFWDVGRMAFMIRKSRTLTHINLQHNCPGPAAEILRTAERWVNDRRPSMDCCTKMLRATTSLPEDVIPGIVQHAFIPSLCVMI